MLGFHLPKSLGRFYPIEVIVLRAWSCRNSLLVGMRRWREWYYLFWCDEKYSMMNEERWVFVGPILRKGDVQERENHLSLYTGDKIGGSCFEKYQLKVR